MMRKNNKYEEIECPYCGRWGNITSVNNGGILVVHKIEWGSVCSAQTGKHIKCEIAVDLCAPGYMVRSGLIRNREDGVKNGS